MAQHFLLSASARTLSLAKVMRLSDEDAYQVFKEMRWPGGEPHCPKCGCFAIYTYKARKIFKCKACDAQFSLTTGTIFASRKLAIRDILAAIAIFVNGAKGISALQMSRDLDVQYKTAYVLAHKLREAMASQAPETVGGDVEIDGAYFGGYVKPANHKDNRRDRRLKENQTGKRRAVVVMRERNGRTLPFVFRTEGDAVDTIVARVEDDTTVYADEASVWDELHAPFEVKRVNHSINYRDEDACTNQAESFFSRLRRMEVGTHHHVSGRYLHFYAREAAWREDNRRVSNGEQYTLLARTALAHEVSENWAGYWQRVKN